MLTFDPIFPCIRGDIDEAVEKLQMIHRLDHCSPCARGNSNWNDLLWKIFMLLSDIKNP